MGPALTQNYRPGPSNQDSYQRLREDAPAGFAAWMDRVLGLLPPRDAEDWLRRMQKGSPDMEATLLEAVALDLSVKAGAQLLELHPDLGERAKGHRPDFLLRTGQQDMILEAKMVSMQDDETDRRWKAGQLLWAGLNAALGPRTERLMLTVYRQPGGGLPYKKLAWEVVLALKDLKLKQTRRFDKLIPGLDFGLTLSGTSPEPKPPIGSLGLERVEGAFSELHLGSRMKDAVLKKLKRYGRAHAPMVVLLGADDTWAPTEKNLEEALFGAETMNYQAGDSPKFLGYGRTFDGIFGAPGQRAHTRLSGLLVLGRWSAYRLASALAGDQDTPWVVWVPNPHASHPIPDLFRHFPTWDVTVDGAAFHVARHPGQSLGQVLRQGLGS